MKTLCLSLGLLLLIPCCCDAIHVNFDTVTAPVSCCQGFSFSKVPRNRFSTIKKTHNSCMLKAFIVKTVIGREICFSQNFPWAVETYNRFKNSEGSGQKQLTSWTR